MLTLNNRLIKVFFIFFVFIVISLFSSCSTQLKNGDIIVMPSQNPELSPSYSKNNPVNNVVNVNGTNNSIQSFLNNSQNYYIRPQSKSIINNPFENKWLDFDVVDGLVYLIGKTEEMGSGQEYGSILYVYDVDGQQLLRNAENNNAMYVSIAVHDNKIYAYDMKSGELHEYSTNLSLENKYKLVKGLECSKMVFSKDGWLLMLCFDSNRQNLYIFDHNHKLVKQISPIQLSTSISTTYGNPQKKVDIRDFDIYDSDRVILEIIPKRLCLYNFKEFKIEKVGYFRNDESIIAFDTNILYFVAPSLIGTNANNTSSSTPNRLERILINHSFNWDVKDENIKDWMIAPIELPSNGLMTAHKKIKSRGGFVYMLDYPINTENLEESQIIIVNK